MSPLITTKASASAQGYGLFSASAVASNFYSIATVTPSGTGSFSFSSIPSTWTHLQLRVISRDTRSAATNGYIFQFNGDGSASYTYHDIYGNGSSISVDYGANQTFGNAGYSVSASTFSQVFAVGIYDFVDYSNTNKYKVYKQLGGFDLNGSGTLVFGSVLWMNTNAINQITILPGASANFVSGTSFALYGVK